MRIDLPQGTEVDVLALRSGKNGLPDDIGDLLEGVEPRCGAEYSTWLLIAREQIAASISARLRQETLQAIAGGNYDRAICLSENAVRRDSYNEGAHILPVKSLKHAGSLDAAKRHMEDTSRLFELELGVAQRGRRRDGSRHRLPAPRRERRRGRKGPLAAH